MSDLTHPKYRRDIDGLRAVAVSIVVLFHAFPNLLKGGFIGVDIFFVISGYLISTIIITNLENKSFSFIEFYKRRIKRIFPALLLVLLICLIYGWYILLPDEYQQLGLHVFGGAGFISNLILWNESGYFDNAANTKPLLHLWSLGIEEQFYIIWPLLLYFVWKNKKSFLITTLILVLISFATNIWLINDHKTAAFYSPLSRFWELLIGGLLAYISIKRNKFFQHHNNTKSIFGFIILFISIFLINEERVFPGWWAILPTLSAFLIISAGQDALLNKIILSNRIMVTIGLISYPLYLWHWPILIMGKLTKSSVLNPQERIYLIILSIFFAWLTYRFIELSIRNGKFKISLKLAVSMFIVGLTGLSIAGNFLIPRQQSAGLNKILAAKLDWEFPGTYLTRIPDPNLKYYVENCGNKKTVFIGDSNLEQYTPRIDFVIKHNANKANSAIIIGNPYNGDLLMSIFQNKPNSTTVKTIQHIISDSHVSSIVFAARWTKYDKNLIDKAQFNNLVNFINALRNKKVFIILCMPAGNTLNPENMFDGSRLTTLKVKNIKHITFDISAFKNDVKVSDVKLRELAEYTNAEVIDPLETFCVNGIVPIFDNEQRPLYKDSAHITATYARNNATFIDQTLLK
jgi:peptidoglycan/LPS O-acetylase OafA/YrhL